MHVALVQTCLPTFWIWSLLTVCRCNVASASKILQQMSQGFKFLFHYSNLWASSLDPCFAITADSEIKGRLPTKEEKKDEWSEIPSCVLTASCFWSSSCSESIWLPGWATMSWFLKRVLKKAKEVIFINKVGSVIKWFFSFLDIAATKIWKSVRAIRQF